MTRNGFKEPFFSYRQTFPNPLWSALRIMKQFAETFYKSPSWKNCRNAYLKSKGGLCEECYRKGKIVPAEEVHHIVFITENNVNDPNITLNFDNLIALCRECHRRKHGTQRRYSIDEWGRITPR